VCVFILLICYRELEAKNPTAVDIKAEVEVHLKNKDIIENTLPSSIVIGPFYVNTEGVRQGLSKKRKAIANACLDLLAKKLRTQAEEVRVVDNCIANNLIYV